MVIRNNYFFTFGLFFIGWAYDLIKYIIFVLNTMKENKEYNEIKIKERTKNKRYPSKIIRF